MVTAKVAGSKNIDPTDAGSNPSTSGERDTYTSREVPTRNRNLGVRAEYPNYCGLY